jgi:hypothetical protein
MANQRTGTRTLSSFAAPSAEDMALFASLSPEEQLALLREAVDDGAALEKTDETAAGTRARRQVG